MSTIGRRKPRIVGPNEQPDLPPCSIESEQGILGCILLDPIDKIARARQLLNPTVEAFYDLRHQTIMASLLVMAEANKPIDMITFSQHLRDHQQLEAVGGMAYLSSLQDSTPSAINIGYYIDIVMEKWRLRALVAQSEKVSLMIEEGDPSMQVRAELGRSVREIFHTVEQPKSILDLSRGVIDWVNAKIAGEEEDTLKTGIRAVDRIIQGISDEIVVVGARLSAGKTSYALTLAHNIDPQNSNKPGRTIFITLESSSRVLTKRLVEIRSRMSLRSHGDHLAEHIGEIQAASAWVGRMAIKFFGNEAVQIDSLCSLVIAEVQKGDVKAVIIDYLGLIEADREYFSSKERVASVMKKLKALRDEIRKPIIVLCQLNREAEEERPKSKHLADADEVGRYADVIKLLAMTNEKKEKHNRTLSADVIIAKRRDGETGDAHCIFRKYCGLWEDEPLEPMLPI